MEAKLFKESKYLEELMKSTPKKNSGGSMVSNYFNGKCPSKQCNE